MQQTSPQKYKNNNNKGSCLYMGKWHCIQKTLCAVCLNTFLPQHSLKKKYFKWVTKYVGQLMKTMIFYIYRLFTIIYLYVDNDIFKAK